MTYLERLAARSERVGSVLCVGIDPDPAELPDGFEANLAGIERFAELLLEAAIPVAAAVKPNLAFYEAYGSAGLAALERLRARVPSDLPVVLDAKRGDIASTAARQAVALFDTLGADAITVNPYVGSEGITPLLERMDRFAYVLCRTSNPGAGEIQGLVVEAAGESPAEALWARVARVAAGWGENGNVGLVVGATAPAELSAVRRIAPGLAFLVPGLGVQGGEIDAVLEHGPATGPPAGGRPGGGLIVNVARGIARAAVASVPGAGGTGSGADPAEGLSEAARTWSAKLAVLG